MTKKTISNPSLVDILTSKGNRLLLIKQLYCGVTSSILLVIFFETTCTFDIFKVEAREHCNNEERVYPIFRVSVWLYPFSIEFNILVVAVW